MIIHGGAEMEEIKKDLLEKLKSEGFEIAEDAVLKLFKVLYPFATALVIATPNKIDDVLIPILAVIEPKIIALIDKIDGVEG
jgi:hypothetical protein